MTSTDTAPGKGVTRDVLFDQFSRYRMCADILTHLGGTGSSVLDVGSGQSCLLDRMLPPETVTYVDPLLETHSDSAGDSRFIAGDAQDRRLNGRTFDYVVCVDTLEHVPAADRTAFLRRLRSLAAKGVIIACPCKDAGEAEVTDAYVNSFYQSVFGEDYPWLREHVEYGLPSLRETVRSFASARWRVKVVENGHAPWLRQLLSVTISSLADARAWLCLDGVSEQFNRALYAFDHLPPCYRQVVVALKEDSVSLPKVLPNTPAVRREAQQRWDDLMSGLLGGFMRDLRGRRLVERSHAAPKTTVAPSTTVRALHDAQRALGQRTKALAEAENELESAQRRERTSDEGLQKSRAQLQETGRQLDKMKHELESAVGRCKDTASALERSRADADGLEHQLRSTRSAAGELRRQLADARARVTGLEQAVRTLRQKLDGQERVLTSLRGALYMANTAVAKLQQHGDEHRSQIARYRSSLAEQKWEHRAAHRLIDEHRHVIGQQQRALRQRKDRLQASTDRLRDADRRLLMSQERERLRRRELSAAHARIDEQTVTLTRTQGELLRTRGQLAASERELSTTSEDLAAVRDSLGASEEALSHSQAEAARLGAQAVAAESAVRQATSSLGWRVAHRCHRISAGIRRGSWALMRGTYHRLPMPRSWRWALRAGVFESLGFLLKGSEAYESYRRARDMRIRPGRGLAGGLPVSRPGDQKDYVFFGVIDWHLRYQRPQHLAAGLASRGHRVFYVSPNFIDDPSPGCAVESLDDDGRLVSVRLHVRGAPVIYSQAASPAQLDQLSASLAEVFHEPSLAGIVAVLHHPFWMPVAAVLPNRELVYDCLDHHAGFNNTARSTLVAETQLIEVADLIITTAHWLQERLTSMASNVALVPNACDYEFFSTPPARMYRDKQGRRILGYVGAIADWFDIRLVDSLANAFPECIVLLVGADTCGAQRRLRHHSNVVFTGEVSYASLTGYEYAMDVCLIPFQITPLTIATNPVKVYEYLAVGKPVVATALPEVERLAPTVSIGRSPEHFVECVRAALLTNDDEGAVAERRELAGENRWARRVAAVVDNVASIPRHVVTVVIITYNGVELTRRCVESVLRCQEGCDIDFVFVDNASTDETPTFLKDFCSGNKKARAVLNRDNRGFAAAVNQGLDASTGEYIVVMNNDTMVTPGWLRAMIRHADRDETIGIVGPVTNNIGNEARIETTYTDVAGLMTESRALVRSRQGVCFDLAVAAFFCVLLPRRVYEKVGPLDASFGRGFFEDDDYCRRIVEEGWRVVCAEDAFVHHELSAAFGEVPDEEKRQLFEENLKRFEAKWGKWEPHRYRSSRRVEQATRSDGG